jgi:hypothetical protein
MSNAAMKDTVDEAVAKGEITPLDLMMKAFLQYLGADSTETGKATEAHVKWIEDRPEVPYCALHLLARKALGDSAAVNDTVHRVWEQYLAPTWARTYKGGEQESSQASK